MKRLAAIVITVATLALAGCAVGPGGSTAATVPVYTGVSPPSASTAGTWLHLKGKGDLAKWAFWATLAADGVMGPYTFAHRVRKSGDENSKGWKISVAMLNSPCRDSNGRTRPRFYKLAQWAAGLPTNKTTTPQNSNPVLDCLGFYGILSEQPVPARLKYMWDCIANILAAGQALTMDYHRASWAYKGGHVVVKDGRVVEAKPAGSGWGECARMKV